MVIDTKYGKVSQVAALPSVVISKFLNYMGNPVQVNFELKILELLPTELHQRKTIQFNSNSHMTYVQVNAN